MAAVKCRRKSDWRAMSAKENWGGKSKRHDAKHKYLLPLRVYLWISDHFPIYCLVIPKSAYSRALDVVQRRDTWNLEFLECTVHCKHYWAHFQRWHWNIQKIWHWDERINGFLGSTARQNRVTSGHFAVLFHLLHLWLCYKGSVCYWPVETAHNDSSLRPLACDWLFTDGFHASIPQLLVVHEN